MGKLELNVAKGKIAVSAREQTATAVGDPSEAAVAKRRTALRNAARLHDISFAELARLAGLPTPNVLYNYVNGETAGLSTPTWAKIMPFLPKSDAKALMGLTEIAGENDGNAWQEMLRTRALSQLRASVIELKASLTTFQDGISTCARHIAMLEARLADLAD